MNITSAIRCTFKLLNAFDLYDTDEYEYALNSIRDSIFKHLKPKHSGLISKRAFEAYNNGTPKSELCQEHFYTRTTVARLIIHTFQEGTLTQELLEDILEMANQVHLVLPEENRILAFYQKDGSLDSNNHYRLANIELVEFVERPRGKPFSLFINEQLYGTFQTRAEAVSAGFSNKLLNSLTIDTIFTAKNTHKKSSHIFKAGDTIKYERLQ
jgi:hypothetical protein